MQEPFINIKKKSGEISISHKKSNKSLLNTEFNDSKYTLTIKSNEDSIIKEEENESNNNENISYKERQLSNLFDAYMTSYSKKNYKDLIKDIEEKEDLLCQNSLMSFEIKIIKIKGLMKLLLEEYNYFLQSKNKSFHDLDTMIHKIKNEFQFVSMLIINDNSYMKEVITQIYSKFLFLLSKISLKREDYLKSLGFISLGINMLKIFFIKKRVASDIKTYKIYCKLILELLNILIGDKNYELVLFYSRLLFKIIEVSLKFIYHFNHENKKKISVPLIKKFITYGAIGYVYIGCCLEQLDDPIQSFEAYKQAKFFFKKGSRLGLSFQNLNNVTINNSCSYLTEEIFEKYKLKFTNDKIERLNMQKKLELQKKKDEYELLQNEKLIKLKYIANGITVDPFKVERLENKLNKKLFPSSVVNDLEKIDDELMSFVFTYYNKNQKNNISSYKDKMSSNTKKIMSRYEVYNILMSKNFRDFIMKNKQLQFYNPKTGSKSISIIQRHLNNKIQIESNSKKGNNILKKSFNYAKNTLETSNTNRQVLTTENFNIITTSPNSGRSDEKFIEKNLFKKSKKIKFRNHNNLKYALTQASSNLQKKPSNKIYPLVHLNTTKSMTGTKIKYKLKRNYNDLPCDFEKKNLDKNLMTKNYLRKYSYYDKLSTKELKMQKLILYFKHNNTLYNKKRSVEEKDGVIGKDDITNISLIINENARVKPTVEEKISELNLIKDSFASKENKMSVKMKSAMSKVINKYINERKKLMSKQKIVDSEEIKEKNEKSLLQLNFSIKNINTNISHIKFLSGQNK